VLPRDDSVEHRGDGWSWESLGLKRLKFSKSVNGDGDGSLQLPPKIKLCHTVDGRAFVKGTPRLAAVEHDSEQLRLRGDVSYKAPRRERLGDGLALVAFRKPGEYASSNARLGTVAPSRA
jgi:hypothetical protein